MKNGFYDNELEKYLREQANQHRMYPSDDVWRNIQQEIHGYRKWPALAVIAILIISSLMVGTVIVKPHTELTNTPVQQTEQSRKSPESSKNTAALVDKDYVNHLAVETITRETIARATENLEARKANNTLLATIPINKTDLTAGQTIVLDKEQSEVPALLLQISQSHKDEIEGAQHLPPAEFKIPDSDVFFASLLTRNVSSEKSSSPFIRQKAAYYSLFSDSRVFLENSSPNSQLNLLFNTARKNNSGSSPLARFSGNTSKFDFQFYVTPSISYRRLVDDAKGALSKYYITGLPFAANYVVDVNRVIRHKPAIGYEVGALLGYNLSSSLAIRSGFQFNVRQYNINAFVHDTEPATIALLSGNPNEIFNTVSGFRNIPGTSSIELKNRYYEISTPVTIDWRPVSGKFAWGIAASIQPTYTFDKEPFIITSNYKNYADGSKLLSNWNLNAGLETYLGYNTGKYRWQIGPQVRYQLMPTMDNSYPIREFLIDYGIKIGLVRSLK